MDNPVELRADYQQAIGAKQQHDIDLSRFLITGETIESATAVHTPINAEGEPEGTPAVAEVGTDADGIIPIMLGPLPSDNKPGIHILTVYPIMGTPPEAPIFRVEIRVPF